MNKLIQEWCETEAAQMAAIAADVDDYHGEREAKISVFDHGLLYGDGIFEGIRAYNGRVFKLKEHIDRFYRSPQARSKPGSG